MNKLIHKLLCVSALVGGCGSSSQLDQSPSNLPADVEEAQDVLDALQPVDVSVIDAGEVVSDLGDIADSSISSPCVGYELMGYRDSDGDGFGFGPLEVACSTEGNYVDNNTDCAPDDSTRWQMLTYRAVDQDTDSFAVNRHGDICSGAKLPQQYYSSVVQTEDCDDNSPSLQIYKYLYSDNDLDGVGFGVTQPVCSPSFGILPSWSMQGGDCRPDDNRFWALRDYVAVDLDLDGYPGVSEGRICSGSRLPSGYFSELPQMLDCDDTNTSVFRNYLITHFDSDGDGAFTAFASPVEMCFGHELPANFAIDATNLDCNEESSRQWRMVSEGYVDVDLDGYRVLTSTAVCMGSTYPEGLYETSGDLGVDCDDTSEVRFVNQTIFDDVDLDGVGFGEGVLSCVGDVAPLGTSFVDTDCAPADRSRYRMLTNGFVDRDGDSYTVRTTEQVCYGDILEAPFLEQSSGNDCNDQQPSIFQRRLLFVDIDEDGVGRGEPQAYCIGAAPPPGFAWYGGDIDDSDPDQLTSFETESYIINHF